MAIPKVIHYCWFGGNPLPKLAKKCIKSWKKYCPDYKIIEWNEENFDISKCPLYVRQAYENKKWAFVTDYVRLKVVHDNGGIYLDTDVELVKSLDVLLVNAAYFGFEGDSYVNTGLGFGAVKEFPLLKEIMSEYDDIPFVKENNKFDTLPCPQRNTQVFIKNGLKQDGSLQNIGGAVVFPAEFFCPLDNITYRKKITRNTHSIHWFSASWFSKESMKWKKDKRRKEFFYNIRYFPNRLLKAMLGDVRYKRVKAFFRR